MKVVGVISNTRQLFSLFKDTGVIKLTVSETISEEDWTAFYSQSFTTYNLNTLSNKVGILRVLLFSSKTETVGHEWSAFSSRLVIRSEAIGSIDHFIRHSNPGGSLYHETSARIKKARLIFTNLYHLWRRQDNHFSTKMQVYYVEVLPVLAQAPFVTLYNVD